MCTLGLVYVLYRLSNFNFDEGHCFKPSSVRQLRNNWFISEICTGLSIHLLTCKEVSRKSVLLCTWVSSQRVYRSPLTNELMPTLSRHQGCNKGILCHYLLPLIVRKMPYFIWHSTQLLTYTKHLIRRKKKVKEGRERGRREKRKEGREDKDSMQKCFENRKCHTYIRTQYYYCLH